MNEPSKYTSHDILEIFKEQHRICSPLDPEADQWVSINETMTVEEWRWANDLLDWSDLANYLNKEFRMNVSKEEWKKVLEPASKRTLKQVCDLISECSSKDNYQPIKLLGQNCISASIFRTLKKNLSIKGVNVSDLKPSSTLKDYLTSDFSAMVEEITLTSEPLIDKISVNRKSGIWNYINVFDPNRFEACVSNLETFRDLVERIIEQKVE